MGTQYAEFEEVIYREVPDGLVLKEILGKLGNNAISWEPISLFRQKPTSRILSCQWILSYHAHGFAAKVVAGGNFCIKRKTFASEIDPGRW